MLSTTWKPPSQSSISYLWTVKSDRLCIYKRRMWHLIAASNGIHEITAAFHLSDLLSYSRSLADFTCIFDKLQKDLAQDPLGCGQPLSVKVQFGVGLYQMAHGSLYLTICHVFSIAKETTYKASGQFFKAMIKEFSFHAIRRANFHFSECLFTRNPDVSLPPKFCITQQ